MLAVVVKCLERLEVRPVRHLVELIFRVHAQRKDVVYLVVLERLSFIKLAFKMPFEKLVRAPNQLRRLGWLSRANVLEEVAKASPQTGAEAEGIIRVILVLLTRSHEFLVLRLVDFLSVGNRVGVVVRPLAVLLVDTTLVVPLPRRCTDAIFGTGFDLADNLVHQLGNAQKATALFDFVGQLLVSRAV